MTDKELFDLVRKAYAEANKDYITEQIAKACQSCPNHPSNGGSGICYCTLGSQTIY